MTDQERSTLTALLEASATSVQAAAADLSESQANFRPTEGAWSPLEVLEHLVLIEHGIFQGVGQLLEMPAQPELKAEVAGKDETLINLVPLRRRRAPSPEMFLPPAVCRPLPEALAAFEHARSITLDFARTTQADLRSHFKEHFALKLMDGYQWLLLLGSHAQRHAAQIREAQEHPDYPARATSSGLP